MLLLARRLDARTPALERLPVFGDLADLEGLPVRFPKIGQGLVDRTRAPAAPGAERCLYRRGEAGPLGFEPRGIGRAIGQRVTAHALAGDVERQPVAQGI